MVRNMKNAMVTGHKFDELGSEFPQVIIKTDSAYLVLGMTEHLAKWKLSGYRNTAGDPVVNAEYFMRLDQEVEMLKKLGVYVSFWNVPRSYNEKANDLATFRS